MSDQLKAEERDRLAVEIMCIIILNNPHICI